MTTVGVTDVDGVALVTIDRPPANALDPVLLADGIAAVEALRADPPDAVVLTGAGAFFSGGADLRVVPTLPPDAVAEMSRNVNRIFAAWHGFPRPVVTAVNGHAVAGGFILALCSDYRVVGTSGRFGLTEVKVGIPYPSVAMAVVKAKLAPPVARRLALRAELLDAETMVALGAFDQQVSDAEVLPRSIEVARELAQLPRQTYALVKSQLRDEPPSERRFGGAAWAGEALTEAAEAARRPRRLSQPR